jgi:hypothetical protein
MPSVAHSGARATKTAEQLEAGVGCSCHRSPIVPVAPQSPAADSPANVSDLVLAADLI